MLVLRAWGRRALETLRLLRTIHACMGRKQSEEGVREELVNGRR